MPQRGKLHFFINPYINCTFFIVARYFWGVTKSKLCVGDNAQVWTWSREERGWKRADSISNFERERVGFHSPSRARVVAFALVRKGEEKIREGSAWERCWKWSKEFLVRHDPFDLFTSSWRRSFEKTSADEGLISSRRNFSPSSFILHFQTADLMHVFPKSLFSPVRKQAQRGFGKYCYLFGSTKYIE